MRRQAVKLRPMERALGALRGVPLDVVDDRAGIDLQVKRDRTGATGRLRDVFG